ncbi:hypothetical protein PoB_007186300 [Plakobranchus ocellatus]|uniref:Uncharacterized protein n=1 Tax=Plakobranchus ocellatus TaxID=259542 RepID=A0AAV4DM29_9GAST|nr:hypothetical protein PoB_007186300 [Plakobranchus ocellatus]
MTDIRCLVPQCNISWPSTTAPEVLLKLFDMHERTPHPSTTPTTVSMTTRVFSDRSLEAIPNPRLRNLKEKTSKYRFHITHIPGIRHVAADTISRNPVGAANHLSLPDDANLVSIDNKLPTIPHSFLKAIRVQPDTYTVLQ